MFASMALADHQRYAPRIAVCSGRIKTAQDKGMEALVETSSSVVSPSLPKTHRRDARVSA